MAGFQNFTPRTANLAKVWEGFNPAANFLGGMKAVRQMDLDEAAEQRLRELADTDRMVKETMLPYEAELAKAKIGLTLAQKDYAASRASRDADNASALSVFERSPDDRSQILRLLGLDGDEASPTIKSSGGGASILDATPSSGGSYESFDLQGSANTNNPIVAEFSPKEESGPLYNLSENQTLLASSDSFGVPDTGGRDNLQSQTAASALTPKEGPAMRNAADWDEDPNNFSPLERKNPLTSLEIPEDKRKEIERLNEETGALNKNQDQAASTSEDMGAYLVKGLNQLEKAKDRAQLASGPEKRLVNGLASKLEVLTYQEAAKKLGLDPSMGEYAVKTLTRSGVNGMRRSPSQINQIVDLVKDGMDITEASTFFDAKSRKNLEDKLNGKAASDPLKSATEIQNLLSKFTDESGNPLAGKEAIVDGLNSQLDTAIGAPTGVAAYSYRYGRMSERADKLQRAMDTGVALGDITKDQLPQEIARVNQEQVALSAEKAPYFKTREELAKWLSDPLTRNLPYFTEINGARSLARYNGVDPNTPQVWSPTQSLWVNFSSPAEAKPTPEKPQSEFSEAGQTGQKIRKAGGGLVRAVKGASTAVGEKISNIPAGAINAGASIAEVGAGVFNIPLKIPRASNISESLEKMGLKKYEDGTWGPIKQ